VPTTTAQREAALDLESDEFLDLQRDRLEDVGKVDVLFDVIDPKSADSYAHKSYWLTASWLCDIVRSWSMNISDSGADKPPGALSSFCYW
jgi:hypothetical protein